MFLESDHLTPSRNCFVKFILSLVHKVTIWTCNLGSLILIFAEFPVLDKIQSSIQSDSRWIFQLICSTFNDLQKLLRYFNGTTIFAFFTELFVLLTASAVLTTRGALYLHNWEISIVRLALSAGILSLLIYHKLLDVSEQLYYIQSNCTYALRCKYDLLHQ